MHKALLYNHGQFDPRNRNIVSVEQKFDFIIDRPWAQYEYKLPDGTIEKGTLAFKGTIDLITKINDTTLESIDWKTGKRLDWNTGEVKTWKKIDQ